MAARRIDPVANAVLADSRLANAAALLRRHGKALDPFDVVVGPHDHAPLAGGLLRPIEARGRSEQLADDYAKLKSKCENVKK